MSLEPWPRHIFLFGAHSPTRHICFISGERRVAEAPGQFLYLRLNRRGIMHFDFEKERNGVQAFNSASCPALRYP